MLIQCIGLGKSGRKPAPECVIPADYLSFSTTGRARASEINWPHRKFPRDTRGVARRILLFVACTAALLQPTCSRSDDANRGTSSGGGSSAGGNGDGDGDVDGDGGEISLGGAESGGGSSGGTETGGAETGGTGADGAGGRPELGGESSMGGQDGFCENAIPVVSTAPSTLEETGFYSDNGAKVVASELREFAPRYMLWSDGAVKTRWLYLPECDPIIDTSEMDSWEFPVGTYAFKQFEVDGKLVETRMVHKYGVADEEVLYATYVFDEESLVSHLDGNGHTVERANGPDYTVPNVAAGHCARCHGSSEANAAATGLPSRFLGPSAVDLNHDGPGLTLAGLINEGLLSNPPVGSFSTPGEATQETALGYLHANCGYCHNDTPISQPLETPYALRLKTTDTTLQETGVFMTAVNVPVSNYTSLETEPCTHRIYGGDVAVSCIHERMGLRPVNQMPPLDTARVDQDGLDAVAEFIQALDPPG